MSHRNQPTRASAHQRLPYVRNPTSGFYQVNTSQLTRDLPSYLDFLRTPPMNMTDIAYKRLSNGRFVVEPRKKQSGSEAMEETPTEVASEVDSDGEDVLKLFDMDVEFGEEDMEIDDDDDFPDFEMTLLKEKWRKAIMNAAQGGNNEQKPLCANEKNDGV